MSPCSRTIRFIRFDWRMMNLQRADSRSRGSSLLGPYLRTRRWSCVRDNPSRRAALVLFPRHSCRTLAIVVCSSALRSVVSLRDDLAAGCRARCSASMSAPSQRIAARSRTLRSSLTFPGHSYWRSACRASRVRPAAGRPKDLPISCRKVSLSGTMSAGRSRNGGIWMSKTPRR